MKVGEAMNRGAHIVHAGDSLKDAARIMAREDVGVLPVEEGGRLVGMITDRDIVTRCIARGKGGADKVRDAMTDHVRYCFEEDDLDAVMDNMAEQQVRRLPVMDAAKQLVGILSLADAARNYSPDVVGVAFSGVVAPGGQHAGRG
ncbi:MAG TPA: CBS domain-containing protein [Rhizomicrobium sp.]|nr:CBS domain-containing protein [Rhizomicrobium sp.]